MTNPPFPSSFLSRCRLWALLALLHFYLCSAVLAEDVVDTRFQYYLEDNGRVRVDSDYSLFSIDLNDTLVLDGTLLYSAISGASPTGLPPSTRGGQVPLVTLEDQRYAAALNLTKQVGIQSLKAGISYSYESDYLSLGGSVQDTISLNEKNTDLVLGFAYTHDTVGANGSNLSATKRSYDLMAGVNQILGPNTLLTLNAGFGLKQGFLSDPYKRVLIDDEVFAEHRPEVKREELLFGQLTHYFESWDGSVEVSYRFGHNDHGINSHTEMIAIYKYFFDKRLVVRPSFRYYRQSAADYYDLQFSGDPEFYSSDYRVAAEESLNLGLQLRWFMIPDKLSIDLGYERYLSRGTDGLTSQSAFPDANSITAGIHYQF